MAPMAITGIICSQWRKLCQVYVRSPPFFVWIVLSNEQVLVVDYYLLCGSGDLHLALTNGYYVSLPPQATRMIPSLSWLMR
jgi:hypothetical protein